MRPPTSCDTNANTSARSASVFGLGLSFFVTGLGIVVCVKLLQGLTLDLLLQEPALLWEGLFGR
jgi:hypothetical protein